HNNVVSWRGDFHLIIAKLQIKLSRPGIRVYVPAQDVVVYRHAWKPLCDGENLAVLGFEYTRPISPVGRYDVGIIDGYRGLAAVGLEGFGQEDLHAGVGDQVFGRCAIAKLHRLDVVSTIEIRASIAVAAFRQRND